VRARLVIPCLIEAPAFVPIEMSGSLAKAKIRLSRGGTSYGYKVVAYGDLSAATDPDMTIQFYLGNPTRIYSHSEAWTRTATGWKADGFDLN